MNNEKWTTKPHEWLQFAQCTLTYGSTDRQIYYPTIRGIIVWGILSLLCVILFVCHFVCFFVRYGFLSNGKSQRREILHVRWPTIRTGLLSLEVKGQGHQGQKTHLVLRSPTRLPYEWYAHAASCCCCGAGGRVHLVVGKGWHWRRRAPRLGTGAAAATKAVRWDLRLASLLTNLLTLLLHIPVLCQIVKHVVIPILLRHRKLTSTLSACKVGL